MIKGGLVMGSMITLGIGRMEIDWGKNSFFRDHSALFRPSDVKDVPYYYVDDDDNIITEMKEGYSCKLSQVKNRLNMLGYDYKSIEKIFNAHKSEISKFSPSIEKLSFEDYANVIKGIDISKVDTVEFEKEYADNGYDFGEYVSKCIFAISSIKVDLLRSVDPQYGEDRISFAAYDLSSFLESLDAYIPLRIICENPSYSNYELIWRFNDVVSEEYVDRSEIVKALDKDKKILIVTEGSSDTFVLKRAVKELFPDISDFFEFIDMKDNYPFTGTGNLLNFCKGLAKINIQNNVIIIFDNDTEGLEKYNKAIELNRPRNFIVTKLPSLTDFNGINTIGPQGESVDNINGKAVAIECFLDFDCVSFDPLVRWSSYNEQLGQYQGALQKKDDYVRAFKKANLQDGTYNTKKLVYLVNYICNEWINKP